jgi:hypothetical protein
MSFVVENECFGSGPVISLGKRTKKRKQEIDIEHVTLSELETVTKVVYTLDELSEGKVYESESVRVVEFRVGSLKNGVPFGLEFQFPNLEEIVVVNTSFRIPTTRAMPMEQKKERVLELFESMVGKVESGVVAYKVYDTSYEKEDWTQVFPSRPTFENFEDYV